MRLPWSRRGVSEIIAALLVVCITVSAATLFAAYASGLMGSLLTTVTQPYTEQFSVEYYNWNTLSSLSVDVRNTGVATVNLATADYYLSGIQLTTAPTFSCVSPATSTAVAPSGACSLTWSLTAGSYSSGIAYVLKIVLRDGATFTFSIVAGSNTH
ncbi:MAG TPA: archaellin/type IV pilin N-terminal domain-containing protein [Candidatus Dormibacteraeota bacterium]|nr:archaellin/type IV pilin N-terminal domain-containing protein [Candidatus Dormibacteraeota bacterium]